MMKATRARYTLEFKQEAVRLVEGGQSRAAVAKTLGLVDQTLFNWVKASRQGRMRARTSSNSFGLGGSREVESAGVLGRITTFDMTSGPCVVLIRSLLGKR